MKTITIEHDDGATITLARATLGDGVVARELAAALGETTQAKTMFSLFITQLVDAQNLGHAYKKLTACPAQDKLEMLFEDWCSDIDEVLYPVLVDTVLELRKRIVGEKKQSEPLSNNSSGTAPILNLSSMTTNSPTKTA